MPRAEVAKRGRLWMGCMCMYDNTKQTSFDNGDTVVRQFTSTAEKKKWVFQAVTSMAKRLRYSILGQETRL